MKEIVGKTFSIADENEPVAGCTISKNIYSSGVGDVTVSGIDSNSNTLEITIFSMAKNTDISSETYRTNKFIMVHAGSVEVCSNTHTSHKVCAGESYLALASNEVGFKTQTGAVYTEITFERNSIMNESIKAGEVFTLAEKLPYAEGKIVNMDVVRNDKMKFALMAFDAGEGLSEHAASGEALIFALDGEGEIGYEGKTHSIKAGENFHFAKGGKHWVRAKTKFKMALLLTLE